MAQVSGSYDEERRKRRRSTEGGRSDARWGAPAARWDAKGSRRRKARGAWDRQ